LELGYKNNVKRGKEVPKERKVERRGEVCNHKSNHKPLLDAAVKETVDDFFFNFSFCVIYLIT